MRASFDSVILPLALASLVAGSAFAAEDSIWLERPDGTKQCEPALKKSQQSQLLAVIRKELRKAGVPVLAARLGQDGRMRMQACGAPTGGVVQIRVRNADQEKAKVAGFLPAGGGQ